MIGLSSMLDIAKSALSTSQQALAITGHNVANVNTPGYSRQEAVLSERAPLNGQPGMAGTGVRITSVRRFTDQFVNRQLISAQQNLGRLSVSREELFRLQNAFGDNANQGLGPRLNDFFQGLQDVSTNPSDLAARSVLLANATQLAVQFNQVASDLTTATQSLNFQVQQTVTEVNSLAAQIGELNDKIVTAEATGQNANDFRDQREQTLTELAKRIDVTTVESGAGALTVFVARGQLLVDSGTVRPLSVMNNPEKSGLLSVGFPTGGTRPLSIDSMISNGSLRSLLELRDSTVRDLQQSFDRMAATLANAANQIHRQGFGLDGSTGLDFFSPVSVTARDRSTNEGSASIAAGAVLANSLLTFHDYEIRFSSPTAYSIIDTTTGSAIQGNYTGTAITPPSTDAPVSLITGTNDTLTVTVDGVTSGTVTLNGAAGPGLSYASGAALADEVASKINADATLQAAGKTVAVVYDTTTNRLVITSTATTTTSSVDVTGGTARAVLGLASGISTAASGTYGTPAMWVFDGLSVTLRGTPSAGDVFQVNSYANAARDIAVALSNPASIAASSTRAGVPGNNANMLALVGLGSRSFASLGNSTLSEASRNVAANFGVMARQADREHESQGMLLEQIETLRAQVSGVSMDEELINLMKFQRGFEAAARLVKLTDEMIQTLLSIKP